MEEITLNNGVVMPILGFGVFQIPDAAECERCVLDAIGAGYRSIDTAQIYGNEEAVGRAAEKSGVPREELFLTTKVWITNGGYEKAKASIDESLRKLRTDYVDLLLIHQPFNDYYGTYRAMEEANRAGKVRAIGVSNFIRTVCGPGGVLRDQARRQPGGNARVQPAGEGPGADGEVRYQDGILGALRGRPQWIFTNPVLKDIGEKYGKTPAQTALRFLIQRGVIVIPKTTHRERMEENFNVFDFELSQEDMGAIARLDRGESLSCAIRTRSQSCT